MNTTANPTLIQQSSNQMSVNEAQQPQVITLGVTANQLDKDAANAAYARETGPVLQKEGYRDAAYTGGSISQLQGKLQKIKSAYVLWCESHQHLYKAGHEEAMIRHEELISRYRREASAIDQDMKPLQDKCSVLRQEIDGIRNRNYRLLDSLKVALCLTAWLALGFWLALYYGSAFHLTQLSATDMVDAQGEVIHLFTVENMVKGWPLALFPIAAGILAGFMGNLRNGGLKVFAGEMLLFASMDIALSLLIEKRIGEGFSIMGEQHVLDWNQLWLIIMYGTVGAFFFSLAGYMLNRSLLMNEWNTKRTAAAEAERLLGDADRQLAGLQKQKDEVMDHLTNEELHLKKKREAELYTYWYNGTTLRCLLHDYLEGWHHAVAAVPGHQPEEVERLQADGLEILEKVMEKD